MKFTTLIPTFRNDGQAVGEKEMEAILDQFWSRFGGCSSEGPVHGHWTDDADGKHYQDECIRVTVVCDNYRLADAEALVRTIGRQLGQLAMYFEVRDFDGVRFLRID